jgi:TonB-linked SusC/RagA family outer membrane protein
MKKKSMNAFLQGRKVKKWFLMMKLTMLLILAGLMQVSATVYSQATKFNFRAENKQVVEVLKQIEESSDFRFFYIREQVDVERKVTVRANGATVEQILDELFAGQDISYKVMDDNLVLLSPDENIMKMESVVSQQQNSISGKVTDSSNQPLPGVTVIVKGTTTGTVTNADGNYTLSNIPENATLQFSFVGMKAQEIAVGDKTNIDVTLADETVGIDEVVAVGYGSMKKSDLTGSVSSVKTEELASIPVRSAAEALQGKVAGVNITSTGGSPGTPPSVRIRGIGTVNGNNPLYVVDGFPQQDIGWLNQNDIASMEILKDASAAAIYGSRGANGVIILTTKKGVMNTTHKMSVNLDMYYGVQEVTKKFDMMNAEEFIDYRNLAYTNGTGQAWTTPAEKESMLTFLKDNFGNTNGTNWQNEIFQAAPIQNYNLSISNGTEKTSFYTSLGYMSQDGIVKESDYQRISWRTTLDNQLTKWAKLSSNFSVVSQSRRTVVENTIYNGTIFCALTADPVSPVNRTNLINVPDYLSNLLLTDKIDISNPYTYYSPIFFSNRHNPVAQQAINKDNVWKDLTIKGGINLDLDLTSWLKYRGTVNTSISLANPEYFTPSYYIGPYQNNIEGSVGNASYQINYTVIDNLFTFDKTYDWLGKQHTTFMLGNSVEMTKSSSFSAAKTGIVTNDESQRVIDAATKDASATGIKSEASLVSFFGRIFHSWQDKYLLTATVRYDGSSNFGAGNKWGVFPSVSGAWSFSQENFVKSLLGNSLSNGKLRVSWGQIGNQAIDGGAYRSSYSLNRGYYLYGGGWQLAGGKSYMGNPDVKWETTEQTNIGIDLGFLANRLTFTLDYFNKKTEDMLLQIPLPKYIGYTNNPWVNAGSIENRGIELGLNYTGNIGELEYNLGGNLFSYANKVLSLGGGQPLYGVGYDNIKTITKTEVGQPVGYFYGLKTDGIFQSQAEIDNYTNAKGEKVVLVKARPGDLKYVDVNEDGQISDADRTSIGSPFAKLTYGFNLGFKYKGFDLSMTIYGVQGNKIMNMKKLDLYSGTAYYNAPKDLMTTAWSPTNPSNTQFQINTDNSSNVQVSDWLVEDGSYLQLKNLQIGYNLPSVHLKKAFMQEMRIWIGGYNLFTTTNYSGMSPEIGDSNPLFNGVDIGFYPQARQYLMGLSIKF